MTVGRFLRMLEEELGAAADDLRDMEALLSERFEERSITAYVYRENTALLEREALALENLRTSVGTLDAATFGSIEAVVQHVQAMVRRRVESGGLPGALVPLVDRRLERLQEYIHNGTGGSSL